MEGEDNLPDLVNLCGNAEYDSIHDSLIMNL